MNATAKRSQKPKLSNTGDGDYHLRSTRTNIHRSWPFNTRPRSKRGQSKLLRPEKGGKQKPGVQRRQDGWVETTTQSQSAQAQPSAQEKKNPLLSQLQTPKALEGSDTKSTLQI
jgi:hypothetical protein